MSERYNQYASPAAVFPELIDQKFEQLTDPNCRVGWHDTSAEAIMLFPSEPLDGYPDAKRVVLGRSTLDLDPEVQAKEYIPKPTLHIEELDENRTLIYVRDGRLWKRHTFTEQRQPRVEKLGTFGLGLPIEDEEEAQRLITWLLALKERPTPLYNPLPVHENARGLWTARFALPRRDSRESVLQTIQDFAAEGMPDPLDVPRGASAEEWYRQSAMRSLSGVLLGENDAEYVSEVTFARDPSRRYGVRTPEDLDEHVNELADRLGWIREDELITEGFMRTIMGRNKSAYDSSMGAFTLDEARARLPAGSDLSIVEGYLFSTGPGVLNYGEPAAVASANANLADPRSDARIVQAMAGFAYALNRQHRWVLEALDRTVAYELNI